MPNIEYSLENTSAEQDKDLFYATEDLHGLKYSTESSIENPRESMEERMKQSIIHSNNTFLIWNNISYHGTYRLDSTSKILLSSRAVTILGSFPDLCNWFQTEN